MYRVCMCRKKLIWMREFREIAKFGIFQTQGPSIKVEELNADVALKFKIQTLILKNKPCSSVVEH